MQRTALALVGSLLAVAAVVGAPRPTPLQSETANAKDALAIVAGETIRTADVDNLIAGELDQLRQREKALRQQALDQVITRRVVEAEAASRGTTVEAMLKGEVRDKVKVTPEEVKAFYEANKASIAAQSEAEALRQAESDLLQQRQGAAHLAFLRSLRAKAGVRVLVQPDRVTVDPGGPTRGPQGAPVTIVEFSDFQCPYCMRVRPSLRAVREVYADKVRFVYKDFPLDFHTQAAKAAEAARCAGDQGKFWEMYDRLFANQGKLDVPALKQHALALGLAAPAFDACIDSGRFAEAVRTDAAEGRRVGVNGTPAYLINGRMLVGAQPFMGFAQVIEDELERAANNAAR
jgi:protein-disulfide isomerase